PATLASSPLSLHDALPICNGMTEVQVYRFPNLLCTDRGHAISQQAPRWEKTLTGIAGEIYQLWSDYLQPRGYRIRYQIIDSPGRSEEHTSELQSRGHLVCR